MPRTSNTQMYEFSLVGDDYEEVLEQLAKITQYTPITYLLVNDHGNIELKVNTDKETFTELIHDISEGHEFEGNEESIEDYLEDAPWKSE